MRAPAAGASAANARCQKCLQIGHWTYQCSGEAVYKARPTRTQQLLNPKVRYLAQNSALMRWWSTANGSANISTNYSPGDQHITLSLLVQLRPKFLEPSEVLLEDQGKDPRASAPRKRRRHDSGSSSSDSDSSATDSGSASSSSDSDSSSSDSDGSTTSGKHAIISICVDQDVTYYCTKSLQQSN